jgi:hypothetical protein
MNKKVRPIENLPYWYLNLVICISVILIFFSFLVLTNVLNVNLLNIQDALKILPIWVSLILAIIFLTFYISTIILIIKYIFIKRSSLLSKILLLYPIVYYYILMFLIIVIGSFIPLTIRQNYALELASILYILVWTVPLIMSFKLLKKIR